VTGVQTCALPISTNRWLYQRIHASYIYQITREGREFIRKWLSQDEELP
jgi:DNA-binding PadR family transcriptional regulator